MKNTRKIEEKHSTAARNLLPIHLLLHHLLPLTLFCTILTMNISLQDVWCRSISILITTMINHLRINGSPALLILDLLLSHPRPHLHHQSWILIYHQTYIPCPMNHPPELTPAHHCHRHPPSHRGGCPIF